MTDQFYMDEMEKVLETVELAAEQVKKAELTPILFGLVKAGAINRLVKKFHLDPEEAESHVAAAAGEL